MWVWQGRWNHNVTAGLPVSVYCESDWNLKVSLGKAVLRVTCLWVSFRPSRNAQCLCWLGCLTCKHACKTKRTNRPTKWKEPWCQVYADNNGLMNTLIVICGIWMYMLTCAYINIYTYIHGLMHILYVNICRSLHFTCSDVVSMLWGCDVCFMLRFTCQRRVG
jgi:hypothetical protein